LKESRVVGAVVRHLFAEGGDYIATVEESEANDYSARTLVPAAFDSDMQAVPQKFAAIMRLARRIGVSAGTPSASPS
jgi:hypothetical protein